MDGWIHFNLYNQIKFSVHVFLLILNQILKHQIA